MLNVLQIPVGELFALLTAICFAAGLNLYATVAVLGLLAHLGHLPLPPGLHLLQSWPVIVADSTIIWVASFPVSREFAPRGRSQKIVAFEASEI